MTKTSTRGGLLTRALSCGCAMALAASLAPAAGIAWAALAGTPAEVTVNVGTLDSNSSYAVFSSSKASIAAKDLKSQAVLYKDAGGWGVAATDRFASIDAILEAAGLDQYWGEGASLAYDSSSSAAHVAANVNASSFKSYASYQDRYFYGATEADTVTKSISSPSGTPVETGIAFDAYMATVGSEIDGKTPSPADAQHTADLIIAALQNNQEPNGAASAATSAYMNGLTVTDYQNEWNVQDSDAVAVSAPTLSVNILVDEPTVATRIYGEDWADTMNDAVEATLNGGNTTNVVLTTADNYQDALAASGLAGALNCPIVMTDSGSLTKQAAELLEKMPASTFAASSGGTDFNIYVVGGEVVVKPAVIDAIKQLPTFYGKQKVGAGSGLTITRIAGDEAWDTSLEVRKAMYGEKYIAAQPAGTNTKKDVVIACSGGYQDAMSIAPYAYKSGTSIILTNNANVLSDDAVKALVGNGSNIGLLLGGPTPSKVNIVGGTAVVSDQVKVQLAGVAKANIARTWGQSAYDTSNQVATLLVKEDARFDNTAAAAFAAGTVACFATGENYLDALASAAYCANNSAVLLLVSNSDSTTIDGFLASNAAVNDTGLIATAKIFGGEGVLGKAVQMDINQTLIDN